MAGDEKVKAAQQALKDKGHDPGDVDGRMGPRTQAALRDFQKAQGLQASGRLNSKTMQALGVEGGKTSSAGESSTTGSASPSTSPGASSTGPGATGEKKTEEKK
jgi:peptidoglycan hydrolase-like protein with peptidoglycan-binding domain